MTRLYFETAEIARAFADETLVHRVPVPLPAINEVARALFEIEINGILHMPDENDEFAKMSEAHRLTTCRNAAWLIGRLAMAGFKIAAMTRTERQNSRVPSAATQAPS